MAKIENVLSEDEINEKKYESAKKEIIGWLKNQKRVKDSQLDAYKTQVETLIEGMIEGNIYVNDTDLVVKLQFPINLNQSSVSEIAFKPRVTVNAIHMQLQGVKPEDSTGRILAYIAASSRIDKNILKNIDNCDQALLESVGVFFHT